VQESDQGHSFQAQNPQDLAGHCWLLPKSRYQRPAIVAGKGKVEEDGVHWLIKAEAGNELRFDAKVVNVP
jgi:hypothetical protein